MDIPAFPTHGQAEGDDPRNQILTGGMTLRDYFAGQAIFAGLDWTHYHETGGYAEAAAVAYEIADAMIAERNKRDD